MILLTTVLTDTSYVERRAIRKNDPIKLCARLTENFLTEVYKSNIIRFKLDEDQLQRRIYFVTFVESLEMIFSRYKKLVKYF